MRTKFFRSLFSALFLLVFLTGATAQDVQEGGIASIFSKGVGARQMGLGGAVVAYPQDPTSVFWNPAGMEYLQQKSFSLFYASLLAGASYNFAGYVHPTLNIGTFGVGVSRITTGDIHHLEFTPDILDNFSSDQSEFYLSYAKIIRNLFSFGINLKLEREVIFNSSGVGFGVDVSFLYRPGIDNVFLRDIQLGLTVLNAYAPRIKLEDQIEAIPHRIFLGFAKPFRLGRDRKPLYFLFSVEEGDQESIKFRTGLEYSYQNLGMLRLGFNDDGLSFGAGAAYKQFQLDYAYGKLANGTYNGHRISFTAQFGKTKEELLEVARVRREREINRKVALEQQRKRQKNIQKLLKDANQLYKEEKYFEAKVKFSQVLELDADNLEAAEMIDESDARMKEISDQDIQRILAARQEETEKSKTEEYVSKHVKLGQGFLTKRDFNSAIREFNLALERVPESESIKDLVDKAKTELKKIINKLIDKADNLAKKGEIDGALEYFNQAELLSMNDEVRYKEIEKRISQLETKLNVDDYLTTGIIAYRAKNWTEARKNFEKAMKLVPNDTRITRYYKEAERRENAREERMTPDVNKRFIKAFNLYMSGHLQEAIDIWEALLEKQPYNKRIIDVIDKAKDDLKKQQRIKK